MRNSLLYKLMGAFLLVVFIGALVISIVLIGSTRSAFARYSNRNGQVVAARLADRLGSYYSLNSSWAGVEDYLNLEQWAGVENSQGSMMRMGRMMPGSGIIAAMNLRISLADQDGRIIADSRGLQEDGQLSAQELKNGVPVMADGVRVGTISTASEGIGSLLAREFLAAVNTAIFKSMAVAGVIALILGSILFKQITSPLGKMQRAASQISAGDLSARVEVTSKDELGALAQSFNEMAETLSSAETQRRQMAADVAHELRTPLAAIQATLEGLQDGVLPADQEQISTLVTETALLNRMVEDLRLLSLVEAGRLQLDIRKVTVDELIQRVVDLMLPLASQQGVELIREPSGDLPPVRADADRIAQVLNNLVSNALRYTPEGGRVILGAVYESTRREVLVSVSDTGTGIPASDLPHIFDRFYRADRSRSRGSGGSGLGLAIVQELVEAHGGTIHAESLVFSGQHGEPCGTRIVFSLPAA
jgi:two-component system OmpR family sensor kinase/two-component system sensor histidine kinase BaeS